MPDFVTGFLAQAANRCRIFRAPPKCTMELAGLLSAVTDIAGDVFASCPTSRAAVPTAWPARERSSLIAVSRPEPGESSQPPQRHDESSGERRYAPGQTEGWGQLSSVASCLDLQRMNEYLRAAVSHVHLCDRTWPVKVPAQSRVRSLPSRLRSHSAKIRAQSPNLGAVRKIASTLSHFFASCQTLSFALGDQAAIKTNDGSKLSLSRRKKEGEAKDDG